MPEKNLTALIIAYILIHIHHYLIAASIVVIMPSLAVIGSLLANPNDIIGFGFLLIGGLLSSILLDLKRFEMKAAGITNLLFAFKFSTVPDV